jgi:hypothetical protein
MLHRYPVRLPPMELDLVEVSGGGASPSEFEGRTADDRPVYIRYRWGWLTICVGPPGAEDVDYQDERYQLLSREIADGYHGYITLEQVSDLTGITVRGRRLSLSPEDWDVREDLGGCRDFSGRIWSWERQLNCTLADMARFEAALLAAFPGSTRLKYVRTIVRPGNAGDLPVRRTLEPADPGPASIVGIGGDQEEVRRRFDGSRGAARGELRTAFTLAIELYAFAHSHPHRRMRRRSLTLPWIVADVAPWRLGTLSSEFVGAEPASRAAFDKASRLADEHFTRRAQCFDLETRRPLGFEFRDTWIGRDVERWCLARRKRYVEVRCTEERWLGWRPAREERPPLTP